MANKTGIIFGIAGFGLILAWSGITNKGVLVTVADIAGGRRPTPGTPQSFGLNLGGSSGNTTTTQGDTLTTVTMGSGGSSTAQSAVGFAVAQVGKPYVWGGTGPNGFDCSGLIYAAYKQAGKTIPRISEMQIVYGQSIPKGQEVVGDLMFPEPGHVVMCIGGGQCVESPHTGLNVRVRGYSADEFVVRRRIA